MPTLEQTIQTMRMHTHFADTELSVMMGVRKAYAVGHEPDDISPVQEQWIDKLGSAIARLFVAAEQDAAKVRAACLTPLDVGHTFFEAAMTQDHDKLEHATNILVSQLRNAHIAGNIELDGGVRHRSDSVADFLTGYRA